jgi:hypothetical protein
LQNGSLDGVIAEPLGQLPKCIDKLIIAAVPKCCAPNESKDLVGIRSGLPIFSTYAGTAQCSPDRDTDLTRKNIRSTCRYVKQATARLPWTELRPLDITANGE